MEMPPSIPELPARIDAEVPSLIAIRRDLHAHPQLAFHETYASGVVCRELKRLGIPFEAGLGETGVVGWILPDDPLAAKNKALGLRADMDALPIEEATDVDYASTNAGAMHACGHDGHTTILLGTARVLASMRNRLRRPVKLVFQPAEEVGGGAVRMIEDGALDARTGGIDVSQMFTMHGWPNTRLGTIATRPGPMFASMDQLQIVLTGRPGHAAAPHLTSDPIFAAAQLISSLQSVVSRNVDPTEPAVLTIASIHAGSAFNIIPERAELLGTIRAVTSETRDLIHERMRRITEQTAVALGCQADIDVDSGYPVTVNDADFTFQVVAAAGAALGAENAARMEHPALVAEDFAFYGQQVPSCLVLLGLRPPGRVDYPGLHTSRFDFNDDAISLGIRLMCHVALG